MSNTRASSKKNTPPKTASRKTSRRTSHNASHGASHNKGLPLPMKRLVRLLFGKNKKQNSITSRKALWAGGSAATLALLAIVPGAKTSQAIANATCQQVIKSGAEISRSQLSSLLAVPKGASPAAVRQVINEPYCLLPATNEGQSVKGQSAKGQSVKGQSVKGQSVKGQSAKDAPEKVATREAYPLAFDPEAWVVVNYDSGTYVDYDFVFKH
jgi:hypothetical protein